MKEPTKRKIFAASIYTIVAIMLIAAARLCIGCTTVEPVEYDERWYMVEVGHENNRRP